MKYLWLILWNILPEHIKCTTSLSSFRMKYQLHLWNQWINTSHRYCMHVTWNQNTFLAFLSLSLVLSCLYCYVFSMSHVNDHWWHNFVFGINLRKARRPMLIPPHSVNVCKPLCIFCLYTCKFRYVMLIVKWMHYSSFYPIAELHWI